MNGPPSMRTRSCSMAAISRRSCAADLLQLNGLGIALVGAMPKSPLSVISPEQQHEPAAQTVRTLQAWRDHAAEPPGDGALDPQPRGAARHGAEPAGSGLLRPARLGWIAD